MKVLMISPVSAPGGAELIFADTVRAFHSRGHDVCAVFLAEGGLADQLSREGYQVETLRTGRTRNLLSTFRVLIRLRKLARGHQSDSLFASHSKGYIYGALATLGMRLVRVWRQVLIPAPPSLLDRVASALPTDMIICNSAATQSAQMKITRWPVTVIHPGVDTERFTPGAAATLRQKIGAAEGAPLVGLVARMQRWKGQIEFVESAEIVSREFPSAHFLLIGGALAGIEPEFPLVVQARIDSLGLADRVHILGHLEAPEKWIPELTVLVNASQAEPFGNVLLQAMSSGVPVVAARAGGPAEIVRDGLDGVLVASNQPKDLAMGLRAVMTGTAREQMGEKARSRAIESFSVDVMIEKFERALRGSS